MYDKEDESKNNSKFLYYKTTSMCPVCNELVPGEIISKNNKIYVQRNCPTHGLFEGLTCSDQEWYEKLPMFYTPGIKPQNTKKPSKGCPSDCGLCSSHSHIAGTFAIEISNRCNANCPTCLANNQNTFELSVDEVADALVTMLKSQSYINTLTLSGGEPTVHPQFFEILQLLHRPEIGRIAINSNGIRIAKDEEFVKRLAQEKDIYICLHYDGQKSNELRKIPQSIQKKALENLDRHGIDMVPVVLAAKDINDKELGEIVQTLLLNYTTVKSIIISLMTYSGRGLEFPGDPLNRLTIPEALDSIEETTNQLLHKKDFMPLPMPNPLCAAIGYYFVMDNELTPLIPLGDLKEIIEYTKNAHFAEFTPEFGNFMRDSMDSIYANPEKYPNSDKLIGKFRFLLKTLFPTDKNLDSKERTKLAEKYIRAVYLMQFMDSWTFDSKRLSRCSCQHVLPDGKIVPSCGYYAYHRRFDERFQECI